jgi:hypothetical protein
VLSVEDWAEIRRLHRAEGMGIKTIARRLGISKNTVRRALSLHEPPRYQRPVRGSIVDGRTADPGVAGGVPGDALDSDHGTDRVDAR